MTPADATREPTPEEIELLAAGSLTVEEAMAFSGLSQTELYRLMGIKAIRWFRPHKCRLIVKTSLQIHLARLYIADPEPESRKFVPRPKPLRLHNPGSRAGTSRITSRKDSP